jgi:hypothetical protein
MTSSSVANRFLRTSSVIACIATILLVTAPDSGATKTLEEITEDTYELSPTGSLTIRNQDGRIYLYGSGGSELKVKVIRKAFSQERLDQLKVNVSIDGDDAVIETAFPPKPEGWSTSDRSGTVEYLINVPQHCTVKKAELANGEIMIDGMRGPSVDAEVGNGRIHARNCFTSARFRLERGGMEVFYGWWERRAFSLSAEIATGNVRVLIPSDANARLNATTVNGNLQSRFAAPGQNLGRTLETTLGDEGANAELTLRATNGNVRIDKSY